MESVRRGSARATGGKPSSRSWLVGILCFVGMVATYAFPSIATAADSPRRPNIVVILGDDMGFADMGSFGSEIRTPNLDSLASQGVRFTNFYTNPSCSPTRATLLSGVDTHRNGLGNMDEWTAPNQRSAVGYEGYLNNRVATLPQLLRDAGYSVAAVHRLRLRMDERAAEPSRDILDAADPLSEIRFVADTWLTTLEEHRRLLVAPSWKYVLNYETRWMNRHQLVDATYAAGKRLNRIKAEYGLIPVRQAEATAAYAEANIKRQSGLAAQNTITPFQLEQATKDRDLAVALALLIFLPWMINMATDFTRHMFELIPTLAG